LHQYNQSSYLSKAGHPHILKNFYKDTINILLFQIIV